jgi:hypothetical protein
MIAPNNGDEIRREFYRNAHNRIGSFSEQLLRALGPREPEPLDDALEERIVFLIRRELREFARQLPGMVDRIKRCEEPRPTSACNLAGSVLTRTPAGNGSCPKHPKSLTA